jgi:hypothetical protein
LWELIKAIILASLNFWKSSNNKINSKIF